MRPLAAWSLLSGLLLGGCCDEGSMSSETQTFEDCEELLCGVSVLAGSVRIVTTWHPGQHALEIAPGSDVIVVRSWGGGSAARSFRFDFLGQCADGGQLLLNEREVRLPTDGRVVLRSGAPLGLDDPRPDGGTPSYADDVRFQVRGSASCWVDDIVVTGTIVACY